MTASRASSAFRPLGSVGFRLASGGRWSYLPLGVAAAGHSPAAPALDHWSSSELTRAAPVADATGRIGTSSQRYRIWRATGSFGHVHRRLAAVHRFLSGFHNRVFSGRGFPVTIRDWCELGDGMPADLRTIDEIRRRVISDLVYSHLVPEDLPASPFGDDLGTTPAENGRTEGSEKAQEPRVLRVVSS